ncbi:MAG: hypothetical protein ABJN36_08905 [Cyclobacteriaceae bacterium]
MKILILLLSFLIVISTFAQPDVLEYRTISIKGITYQSSSADLISVFGKPVERYDANYECGGYEKSQPGIETTELYKYPGFEVLLVNDTVTFELISFADLAEQFAVKSKQIDLSSNTTIEELKIAFPNSYETWRKSNSSVFRLWPCSYCDAEIQLTIIEGRIETIEFWSPC